MKKFILKKLVLAVICLNFQPVMADFAKPFAEGQHQDIKWEVRFNHLAKPTCKHPGQKEYVWCEGSDMFAVDDVNGVNDKLKSWLKDETVKSVYITFFSASNKSMKYAICEASQTKKINFFIDISSESDLRNFFRYDCADKGIPADMNNIKVIGKGKGLGGLMHMKIVAALQEDSIYADLSDTTVRFTSSSANLSSYGTTLHFENWLFFETPGKNRIAQENVCVFKALDKDENNSREAFAANYKTCYDKIKTKKRNDLKFFAVPHDKLKGLPRPIDEMRKMVRNANEKVLVAIHRLTTSSIYRLIEDAGYNLGKYNPNTGDGVAVVFDDDTLRTGVKNGGPAHDVGANDVNAYRTVRKYSDVRFLETNAETNLHLHHNKFIVTEDAVFQGAGNFTGASLNTYGNGNYEQFYVIRIPEIRDAYEKAWKILYGLGTTAEDHPVGSNPERPLKKGKFGYDFAD